MPEASIEPVKICSGCGKDLSPGGTRRIGICVWCVAAEKTTSVKVPRVSYGRDN